jgi:hypothetical protein
MRFRCTRRSCIPTGEARRLVQTPRCASHQNLFARHSFLMWRLGSFTFRDEIFSKRFSLQALSIADEGSSGTTSFRQGAQAKGFADWRDDVLSI